MAARGWGLVLVGSTAAQKLSQVAVLLQLAYVLPEHIYAQYGFAVLASGSIFGIVVGVAINMAIGEGLNKRSGRKGAISLVFRISPLLFFYFICATANQLAFGPVGLTLMTALMSVIYVAINNLNMAILSVFAARGSFRRASLGYIMNIALIALALIAIGRQPNVSLDFCLNLLTSVALLAFFINNVLGVFEQAIQGPAESKRALVGDLRFFSVAVKINLAGAFFQAAVLFSLNWLAANGTSTDLAQVAFASQILNQFGFIGVVIYPFFLRVRASGVDDLALFWRWTVLIGMLGFVVLGCVLAGIYLFTSACDSRNCFGLSGASRLSIVSGTLIGILVVLRSPIAWIMQLNSFAGIEVFSHTLAALILAAPVLLWPYADTVFGMRVAAQVLLIGLPTLIFASKKRNGTFS